ncbi:MAG: hypothetical protein CMD26_05905 [Flavobacteriales bacterium]|nr:hypothetical protein [Flavobacteriales bacterium]
MKDSNFDFIWLLRLITRQYKLLIIISLLTILTSSLVSIFLIEEKFSSSVIIYPTTTNSVSQALLIEHNPYRKDILEFGEEEEAEQLLQILNSDEMRDSIINKFDLYNHYNISQNETFHKTMIHTLYKGSVKIQKTKFNSIRITVMDKNPIIAANIANSYLSLMDVVISRIKHNRATQALSILQNRKELLYKERNLTQDSLQEFRLNGIISITAQTERLTEQYAIALAANNLSGASRIKKELDKLALHAGKHDMLLRKSYHIEDELSAIEFEVDRVRVDANYILENKFIINKAYPSDKKSQPIRSVIVLGSLMSVLFLSILFLSILESSMYLKK